MSCMMNYRRSRGSSVRKPLFPWMKVLAGMFRSLKNSHYIYGYIIHFMKQRFAGKKLLILLVIASLPFISGCGGGGSKSTPEATLAVTTNPAIGSTQAPAVAPFNVTVTITSAMPASGVTIAVSAAPDG